MYRFLSVAIVAILFVSGCKSEATSEKKDPENSAAKPSEKAVETKSGASLEVNGENTKIEFVGTHVGEKPDPRKGGFKNLSGSIGLDAGKITSIAVEIDTSSLYTEIPKLTNHLKSPDFFDVREYPKASFESTKITAGSDGNVTVKGNLKLRDITKEVSFSASVGTTGGGVKLESSFEIDRTEFGMDYGPDKVEKIVTMKVTVDS